MSIRQEKRVDRVAEGERGPLDMHLQMTTWPRSPTGSSTRNGPLARCFRECRPQYKHAKPRKLTWWHCAQGSFRGRSGRILRALAIHEQFSPGGDLPDQVVDALLLQMTGLGRPEVKAKIYQASVPRSRPRSTRLLSLPSALRSRPRSTRLSP